MLRVSAVAVEGDRDQDLIGPDARHGSFVHRLGKDRLPGSGLSRERVQPAGKVELRGPDQDEVLDPEAT